MDQGLIDTACLRSELASTGEQAWVRALVLRTGASWQARHIVAVVGNEPPGWVTTTWQYEAIAFVSCAVPAAALGSLLGGTPVELDGLKVTAAPSGQTTWRRQPSFARHDPTPLPWPTKDFKVPPADPSVSSQLPPGFLIGTGPSFPDPFTALRAFFEGDFSLVGAASPPSDLVVVRWVQTDAWLGRVHVTPTHLSVDVGGSMVEGVCLEVYGRSARTTRFLSGEGTVVIDMPEGPPDHSWLWLKRGTDWLDYRALIEPWTAREQLAAAGVEIEVPDDPRSAAEALIAAGEGPRLEFKSKLPATAEERRSTFKTVAAFATGDGGEIVFGVDPDEVTVVGLAAGDPATLRDQLGDMIRARVIPTPPFEVSCHALDAGTVLVLHVDAGPSPPYGISVDKGSSDKPEYYVRRGASTFHAQPSDIRESVLARVPNPVPDPYPRFR